MAKVVEFDLGAGRFRELSLEELAGAEPLEDRCYWYDLQAAAPGELAVAAERVGLPDDVLEEWRDPEASPRLIERADCIMLTLEHWDPIREDAAESRPVQIHVYLGERDCVTFSEEPVPCLGEVERTYERNLRFAQSVGFVLFLVVDELVQDYVHGLRPLEGESAEIDERIYRELTEGVNEEILRLKRRTLRFKRVVASARDVLMHLSGRRLAVITEAGQQSLGQVYNHAQVLVNSIDSVLEMINSSQDSFMSLNSKKLNETMKVLTLFASIVLPMTLIAGIYGMNFDNMPELSWAYGYYMALGFMGGSGILLLLLFWWKGWL